jgi:hypothetical protein
MTGITAARRSGVLGCLASWIGNRRQDISERLHAKEDALFRQAGWTVTRAPRAFSGAYRFGGRQS